MTEETVANNTTNHKVKMMEEQLQKKLTRQVVASLVSCVHCGMCNDSCHYVMTHPDDPTMTPSYKADQLRKIFKRNHDWTGRILPWWVKAGKQLTDDHLDNLKDIAFGTCTNCRRCTFNCPMGVDTATLNRIMRGLLSHVGVMPEGVRVVSKDQWEIGNQMGVLKEDYLETRWSGCLRRNCRTSWDTIPRHQDPRWTRRTPTSSTPSIRARRNTTRAPSPRPPLIFHAARAKNWTMTSEGWDHDQLRPLQRATTCLAAACGKARLRLHRGDRRRASW